MNNGLIPRPSGVEGLLWLDFEHTGLEPDGNLLLEVAAVATDYGLNVLGEYESFVLQDPDEVTRLLAANSWWVERAEHAKVMTEGAAKGKPVDLVDEQLSAFATDFLVGPVFLAGNTIYQDRKWVEVCLPNLEDQLHYRMVDISGFKVILKGLVGLEMPKKENHRAMSDILESIDELRYFMKKIGNVSIASMF